MEKAKSDIEKIEAFISEGHDLNTFQWFGQTLLQRACLKGDIKSVKLLIENKADLNINSESGWTTLDFAIYNGRIKIVELLINAGSIIDNTSLYTASCKRRSNIIKLLIHKGANIKESQDALLAAGFHGFPEIIELLVKAGMDVNHQDHLGQTVLMYASEKGQVQSSKHHETVKKLLELNADPSIRNRDGKTALDLATYKNQSEIILLLNALKKHQ